jgi:hypothetical protein
MLVAGDLVAQLLGQIGGEPAAHLLAERGFLGGIVEIHG